MTKESIIKEVCNLMKVNYHHFDDHKMSLNYFDFEISSIPKIVVYSETFGRWQFAILEDMSVVTEYTPLFESLKSINERVESLLSKHDKRIEKSNNGISEYYKRIKDSENYLKNNNCSEIINN